MIRESFIFRREWHEAIKELDDSVRFEIYEAIVAEAFDLEKKKLSPLAKMAMTFISQRLQCDKDKYMSICLRNSTNGAKGGRPRKTQINPNNPQNPVGILETQENPEKPKKADNDIQDTNVSMSISNNKKEKDTDVSKKKNPSYSAEFESDWQAYDRKGSKKDSYAAWKQLSEEDKIKMRCHMPHYLQSNERKYLKDFERYIKRRTFDSPVYKGSVLLYDPAKNDNPEEYHPLTDDIFQTWNEERKCLRFNGDLNHLNDGYTDDNRPDGATVAWGMYSWKWSKELKDWVAQ